MYERYTDRAQKILQLANQEAQRFNHEYIGTEHILLGLIKEGSGVAANVLKNFDIQLQSIRSEVERLIQSGPDKLMTGKLPQTPRAKMVIEYSMEAARYLGDDCVGSEHILLGLLREREGVAAQDIDEFRIDYREGPPRDFEYRRSGSKWQKTSRSPIDQGQAGRTFTNTSTKKIVENALEEARILEHDYVGGEHIFWDCSTSLKV